MLAAVAAIVATGLFGACRPASQTDQGSCAKRIEFENRTYTEMGAPGFTVGDKMGDTPLIPCIDHGTPGSEPTPPKTQTMQVFAASGVDTPIALMVGETAEDASLYGVLDRHGKLSPEAKDLAGEQ